MTDNLGLLERNWPTRRPKDIHSASYGVALAIVFTVVGEVYAVLCTLDAKRHHADLWQLWALVLFIGIAQPWFAAARLYKQVKTTLVASGASPEALAAVRSSAAMALWTVCWGLTFSVVATFWLRHR